MLSDHACHVCGNQTEHYAITETPGKTTTTWMCPRCQRLEQGYVQSPARGDSMGPEDVTIEKMLEWVSAKPAKKIAGCTDSTPLIGTPVEMWMTQLGLISKGNWTGSEVEGKMPAWLEEYLDSTETDWMGEIMEDLLDNYGERTLVTAEEVAGTLRAYMKTEHGMHHEC